MSSMPRAWRCRANTAGRRQIGSIPRGWHLIGRAGQLLDRSLVDRMVAYGERLCFEGAPIIVPPLAQDVTKRIPEVFEGEAIDTELVVPRLTEYERHLVNEAKAASAEALGKAALEVRTRHDSALAEAVSARSGMPFLTALRLVKARHQGRADRLSHSRSPPPAWRTGMDKS